MSNKLLFKSHHQKKKVPIGSQLLRPEIFSSDVPEISSGARVLAWNQEWPLRKRETFGRS